MNDQEKEKRLEEIKTKILNLQAEATVLRSEADKHIAEAQNLSAKRLEVLEKTQILAREYKDLKAPDSLT
jgi:uncharacterized coiled-coil DUF342 family protein